MPEPVITHTESELFTPVQKGKVRDIYDLGDRLLIVATDRLSAFDVVLPDGIPNKGRVLTRISAFWFHRLSHLLPHHLLSTEAADFPDMFRQRPEVFAGRSMLVRKATPIPVECVVRGYLSGSGWSDYRRDGAICGIPLPAGLEESGRLPEPIFSPATKAAAGLHDENIPFEEVVRLVGASMAERLREIALTMYAEAASYAETRGIIIADTKFEFGLDASGDLLWIDEALTPDSSRFWPKDQYQPGGPQPSFDKQYVRDYLLTLSWDKTPPGPRLPREIILTTSRKYEEALRLLTGQDLE